RRNFGSSRTSPRRPAPRRPGRQATWRRGRGRRRRWRDARAEAYATLAREGGTVSVLVRAGRGAVALQRVLQDVPGQDRALDADRVLDDALQRDEIAERVLVGLDLAGHHPAEGTGETQRVVDLPARDGLGHHRGGALRDRAPGALERRRRHDPVVDGD